VAERGLARIAIWTGSVTEIIDSRTTRV